MKNNNNIPPISTVVELNGILTPTTSQSALSSRSQTPTPSVSVVDEADLNIKKVLSKFKLLIPSNFQKLEIEEYLSKKPGQERYLFKIDDKLKILTIPDSLVENLGLELNKIIPYPIYIFSDVLANQIDFTVNIKDESEIFIDCPLTINNLEKELTRWISEIERLKKQIKELKSQSEQMQTNQELETKTKEQANHYQQKINHLETEIKSLRSDTSKTNQIRMKALEDEINYLKENLDKSKKETERLKDELTKLKNQEKGKDENKKSEEYNWTKYWTKWKDINKNFTEELVIEWIKHSFNYEQTAKWINIGFKPDDSEYVYWLDEVAEIDCRKYLNKASPEDQDLLKEQFIKWKTECKYYEPFNKNWLNY